MDVKSAFLYRKIEEEVYVCQPPGFEDPDFPDRVYKVEKALYGLHQAPRAWYETLSTYLLDNGFQRGTIDKTLFIKRFIEVKTASTPLKTQKHLLKDEYGKEVDVHMYRSMIGSLMYLTSSRPDIMFAVCACARYQVNPKAIIKAKTVNGEVQLQALVDGKKIIITESTVRRDLQLEDADGVDCLSNATIFEQLTLMGYEKISQKLTFYKAFFSPQWKFLIHTILQCLSSKTTAWNKFSSIMASAIICLATNHKFNFSKYIFENMVKNLDNVGKFLMYPRFVQVFLDKQVDGMASHKRIYIAPSHTKKIFGNMRRVGKGFSGRETPLFQIIVVQDQAEMGEDEAANEEIDDSLVKVATDRGNINKTRSKATLNEPSSSGNSSETTKTTQANEIASLKRRVKKLERRNKSRTHGLKRLYRVGSSRRVESSEDEDLFGVNDLDGDEVIVESVDVVNTAEETRSVVEEVTDVTIPVSDATTTTTAITDVKITLAQALAELKSAKPKANKVVIQEPEQGTATTTLTLTTTTATTTIIADIIRPKAKGIVFHEQEQAPTPKFSSQQPSQVKVQDKGKDKMVEPKFVKKISKKDILRLDEELDFKLQAEKEEEEEWLAREKDQQVEEVNIAWDDVQAKIEADYQLAQRLQAQEQEEFIDEEKVRLFVQFLEQRRKHFAAKRAEEKRNRPPTRAQQRSIMCTYLKNMEGWKPKSLKNKSFANIQELFDKAMKRVNTFVDCKIELVEESSKKAEVEIAHKSSLKRAREELEQESSKNQKLEEDKESEELKKCLKIVSDDGDDVTIDATPLSTKSLTIVDYKIYKEEKKSYFPIIRVDGNSHMYLTFGKMLKNFDREDLEVLWSIVKARFKKTEPVNYMDNFLLLNLKTMFEHHVEDNVWKNQQGLVKVLN
ncbi:putative ribonuclease H-like domain-containing protein [Tanacetum coccineum]